MRGNIVSETDVARPQAGLFIADDQLMGQARALLEAGGMAVAKAEKVGGGVLDKLPSSEFSGLEGVVFDLRGQRDVFPRAKELLDGCRPDAIVVVLGKENDLGLYRNLKSIGVSDYFAYPFHPDEVAESVLSHLGLACAKKRGRGRIIAGRGVHGGLGSGLIAAGLSALLAEEYDRDTAVVDTCLGSPAVESYLGVNSPGNLGVLLEAEDRLDKVLLDQVIHKPMER